MSQNSVDPRGNIPNFECKVIFASLCICLRPGNRNHIYDNRINRQEYDDININRNSLDTYHSWLRSAKGSASSYSQHKHGKQKSTQSKVAQKVIELKFRVFCYLDNSSKWIVTFTHLLPYPRGNTPQRPFNENVGGPQSRVGRHVMTNKAVTVTAVQPATGHCTQVHGSDGVNLVREQAKRLEIFDSDIPGYNDGVN